MFSVFSLKVPWSTLPKWAHWAAKNSSGIIWCFEDEPIADSKRGEWVAFGRSEKIGVSDTGNNWEASLTKRPDKTGGKRSERKQTSGDRCIENISGACMGWR